MTPQTSHNNDHTWSLSEGGRCLTVLWTEPTTIHPQLFDTRRELAFVQGDRWEPWQIAAVVAAVKAGEDPDQIAVPDTAPSRSLLARAGDWLFRLTDRATSAPVVRRTLGVAR